MRPCLREGEKKKATLPSLLMEFAFKSGHLVWVCPGRKAYPWGWCWVAIRLVLALVHFQFSVEGDTETACIWLQRLKSESDCAIQSLLAPSSGVLQSLGTDSSGLAS